MRPQRPVRVRGVRWRLRGGLRCRGGRRGQGRTRLQPALRRRQIHGAEGTARESHEISHAGDEESTSTL